MIFTSEKRSEDHDRKTGHFKALLKNDHSSDIADHVKNTGHNTKRDHFYILASGKTDFHCCVRLKKPYLFEGELTLRSRE